MLSTILVSSPTVAAGRSGAAGPLMRTLSALVPTTIEGVVRDVALLNLPDDDLTALAEEAGCRLVHGSDFAEAFGRAVAAARAMSLFVLKAGAVPSRLFGEEVARSLGEQAEPSRSLVLRGEPPNLLRRIMPGGSASIAGVILPRERLASARCRDFADIVRRARPARPLPSPAAVRT